MKTYIGVDLGGTNVRVAKVDETGAILQIVKEPTEIGKGVEQVVSKIISLSLIHIFTSDGKEKSGLKQEHASAEVSIDTGKAAKKDTKKKEKKKDNKKSERASESKGADKTDKMCIRDRK